MTNAPDTILRLDRGTQGDEGHFVTIHGHVVFIPDDHGEGANGRGGAFTKHGLEKKLLKHHAERGGDDAPLHRIERARAGRETHRGKLLSSGRSSNRAAIHH